MRFHHHFYHRHHHAVPTLKTGRVGLQLPTFIPMALGGRLAPAKEEHFPDLGVWHLGLIFGDSAQSVFIEVIIMTTQLKADPAAELVRGLCHQPPRRGLGRKLGR